MSTLPRVTPLPSRHKVRTVIEDLVGRPVDLADAPPMPASPTNLFAVFTNDAHALAAVIEVDLGMAARMGGALAMLPKGGVEDAINEVDLSGLLRECCHEVFNVLATVFNVPNAQHVHLYALHGPLGGVPTDVQRFAARAGNRLDLTLTIGGYGPGRMSVVVG